MREMYDRAAEVPSSVIEDCDSVVTGETPSTAASLVPAGGQVVSTSGRAERLGRAGGWRAWALADTRVLAPPSTLNPLP